MDPGTMFMLGSALLPLIGTAVGQFSGNKSFTGSPAEMKQSTPYAPWQQQGLESMFNMGQQKLQNPYAGFDMNKNQAVQNYNQNILPGMLESFASTGGAPSSPAFASQLAQGGSQLGQAIEMLRNQYGMQQEQLGANLMGHGLSPVYSQSYQTPQQPGLTQQFMPTAMKLAGAGIGSAMGVGGGANNWENLFNVFNMLNNNSMGRTNQQAGG